MSGILRRRATLLTVVSAACAEAGPLAPPTFEPSAATVEHVSASLAEPAPALPPAVPGVEDALDRVLPAIPASKATQDLSGSLDALRAALLREDDVAIRTSLRAAEDALTKLGRDLPDEHDPDLDSIELALEAVGEGDGGRPRAGRS